MKTPPGLDEFTWGYLTAAFWTNDDDAPGGCDYMSTDRPQFMFDKLAPSALLQAMEECKNFQADNKFLLTMAGSAEQNGTDFWLTRNHHGAGFWDRGYDGEVGSTLTVLAHAAGSSDLYEGDSGKLYFS